MKKIKYTVEGDERSLEMQKQWEEWSKKFYTAYANYSTGIFDEFENVYRGTHDTTKNVNSKDPNAIKKTNNVPNISYELIESQINTSSPEPNVKSRKPGFEDMATMIQGKIINDMADMSMERITDMNERNTYVHGISSVLVGWNSMLGGHDVMGEKEIKGYHPKQIIPQPDMYYTDDMDYFFIMSAETKKSILDKTGVDVTSEEEQYPEVNQIEGNSPQGRANNNSVTSEIVTLITCLYKDEEGDIGLYSWAGTTPVESLPKYYYPRVNKCTECGEENAQDATECSECGSKKLKQDIKMNEVIEEELVLSPIVYPKKVKKLVTGDDGTVSVDIDYEQVVIERVVPEGTIIKIPAPKKMPLITRINVPLNFSFAGRSDVETIRPQQESIKKTFSRIEEKIIQAGGIIGIPEALRRQISNDVYQVWIGKSADLGSIVVKDTKADITQDISFIQENERIARDTLGITDSYQGKYDPSANSGKAKEVQVEQSAGRLQSKMKNKFVFFGNMFEMMFLMDMCFTQEPRPYLSENKQGKEEYDVFDKHELLMEDADGEWYYNTEFTIKADMGSSLPHDRLFMYEKSLELFKINAIDTKQLLQLLATLEFPIANRILEQVEANEEGEEEIGMVLQALAQMEPEQMMQFLDLPIEEQISLLTEAQSDETNG